MIETDITIFGATFIHLHESGELENVPVDLLARVYLREKLGHPATYTLLVSFDTEEEAVLSKLMWDGE